MKPLFSVIVINFNYERYLGAAIDSALRQTYPAVEVVVVDDCSSDGSRAVMESYGARIVPCFHERNSGMSAGANTGFAAARGEYVLFLDADDYLLPHALEAFAMRFVPGVAQVQARLQLITSDGRVQDIYPPPETPFGPEDARPELARRGRYPTTVTTGLAFARNALEQVMPIPERDFDRSADGYLATVVPLYGRVVSINQELGAYRRHADNHSAFNEGIATRARWRVNHDDHRYAALRAHGLHTGLVIDDAPGLNDPAHLEERLASLAFDPMRHPYPNDCRAKLGILGTRATLKVGHTRKRKAIQSVIFLAVGLAPLPMARRLLAWKIERSTRPKIVDRFSGWLRRRLK